MNSFQKNTQSRCNLVTDKGSTKFVIINLHFTPMLLESNAAFNCAFLFFLSFRHNTVYKVAAHNAPENCENLCL